MVTSDPRTAFGKATDAVQNAAEAVQTTTESVAAAIEDSKRPGGMLDQLARFVREAPLRSLANRVWARCDHRPPTIVPSPAGAVVGSSEERGSLARRDRQFGCLIGSDIQPQLAVGNRIGPTAHRRVLGRFADPRVA
jgi:hypothetical protein